MMRGGINRRFGAGASRRASMCYTKRSGGAVPWWESLETVASTITPISCWSFDASLVTTVGSKISVVPDIWANGTIAHHATQGTDANRPTQVGNTGVFVSGSSIWMALDFSTGEASNDWTILLLANITAIGGGAFRLWLDVTTGRLFLYEVNDTNVAYYDGASRSSSTACTTGNQSLLFSLSNGTGKIDRDGVNLSNSMAYTQRALGGDVAIGGYGGGAGGGFSDINFTGLALWQGKDDTDSAAIMAAGQVIMGT